ncbi:MAG: lytic transglycosylase domain-containing protein [Sulfurovum sp.]
MFFLLRVLTIIILLLSYIDAFDWEKSYPRALYILNEFDIDESYLYDDDFISFVAKREKSLKKFYKKSMSRGEDTILPTIKEIISTKNESNLLIYLSMVESGFISTAKSNKKAVGLWQFIPKTAKAYNLTITKFYDERLDIDKSTTSAIEYLQYLHKRFGKWYIAMMAYNCGEGRMSKAIKKAKSDDLSLLTNSTLKYLPKETRDYIKKILLLAMMGESSEGTSEPVIIEDIENNVTEDINLIKKEALTYNLIPVEITKDANLTKIANIIDMSEEDLHKINPNPLGNSIKIPFDKIYLFYLKYELRK